jgi:hypothetical protein
MFHVGMENASSAAASKGTPFRPTAPAATLNNPAAAAATTAPRPQADITGQELVPASIYGLGHVLLERNWVIPSALMVM